MLLSGMPQEAGAANVSTGSLQFAGTVHIPTFPCPAPQPGELPCVGTFAASTGGAMAGAYDDAQWHMALSTTTFGQFSYTDAVQPGVPCVEGTAAGTAAFDTSVNGQAFGQFKRGNQFFTVRAAAVDYSFTWARTGATAVLRVFGVNIRLQVDSIGSVTVVAGGTASAVATFLPHMESEAPSGCVSGPPTELDGSILGNVGGVAVQP